jgi:hypothetical protein
VPAGAAPAPARDALHAERAARFRALADEQARRALTLSTARLITFLAALAGFLMASEAHGAARASLAGVGAVLLLAFFVLVARHRRAIRDRDWRAELARGSELARARLRREWGALPPPDPRDSPPGHPYAADLDVFGHASLAQLLGSVATAPGRAHLHAWLLAPSPAGGVRARQEAAAELAPMLDLRDEIAARGRLAGAIDPERMSAFLEWANGAPWLRRRPLLRVLAWLVPATTLALAVLGVAGILHAPWWGLGLFAAALVTWRTIGPIHRIYDRASVGEERLAGYAVVFELVAGPEYRTPLLASLREELRGDAAGHGAARTVRRLERILDMAGIRFSTMLYLPAQLFLLWDLHVLAALERWQAGSGHRAAGWMDALGRADALAALAALAHDHPDWTFPTIVETPTSPVYDAVALGHPLLPPATGVRNDVRVGPPGTCLLVTGSNMSGKSTLLRAIGLNAVLAQAGGPVCAHALALPPLEIWTSMRVTDSLERGLSHFMAELERLKAIVDAARRIGRDDPTLLYLVDEVLQGTNSAERQVAARRIVRHLAERRAIGAITTHDLELGDTPALRDVLVPVHFRETVHAGDGAPLTFDYRLRPGVATSRNALRLMEIVGLGDGDG